MCNPDWLLTHGLPVLQVLIYSGQLDVIVATPLTERFLPTVAWKGAEEYSKAERLSWRVQPKDREVAGYVRQVGDFFQVGASGSTSVTHLQGPVAVVSGDVTFCMPWSTAANASDFSSDFIVADNFSVSE